MLERIATACGVALKLHAEKKQFDREVSTGNNGRLGIDRTSRRFGAGFDVLFSRLIPRIPTRLIFYMKRVT